MLVRDRTEDDLGSCLEIARAVKAQDNYPPLGAIDVEWFLRPPEQQHLDSAVALYEAVGWERIGDVVLSAWGTAPIEPPLALFVYVAPTL